MNYIQSYKDLIIWQKSVLFVEQVFEITKLFPQFELYGLVSQIRRAAISIPSNIAEGFERTSPKEYAQFYSIAYGSALEVETQLIISHRVGYISKENFDKLNMLLTEILKMLNKMVHANKTTNRHYPSLTNF